MSDCGDDKIYSLLRFAARIAMCEVDFPLDGSGGTGINLRGSCDYV